MPQREFPPGFDLTKAVRIAVFKASRNLPPDDRDEARADAMLGAAQALNRWDGTGEFGAYAHQRMVGEVIDGIRRRLGRHGEKIIAALEDHTDDEGAVRGWEQTVGSPEPAEDDISLLDDPVVQQAVARLPDKQRQAFLWRVEGVKLAEIGSRFGSSESAACQLVKKARLHVAEALGQPAPPRSVTLTPGQLQTLAYLADGLSYIEISRKMRLSPNTVKTQAWRLRANLGARNTAHAVRLAHQHGLLGFVSSQGLPDRPATLDA